MIKPTLPASELSRLQELRRYDVLDTLPEKQFDNITLMASLICGTPIALVSLLDETRQWFKAKTGLEASETSREISFCGHAILKNDAFEVEDAQTDPRFSGNPLVTGAPHIRFYAGAPLTTSNGENLGTLCVIDRTPRRLNAEQMTALKALAEQTVTLIEMRLTESSLRQATEAKSQFLANMSHEIRTPLSAILGFSEAMRDAKLSATERDHYLDIIHRNGRHLSRLIDDILDLAKVEAKKLSVEETSFSVRDVVHEVIETFREITGRKGVELHVHYDDGIPSSVKSDSFRIRQILVNLIGNAVKFTHEGRIDLQISVSDASNGLEFTVRDTGIGIAPEHADLLFKPFGQAQTSTPRNYGGTGLGLYLTRELCELLGGSLVLKESHPGGGSTFVATIQAPPSRQTPVPVSRPNENTTASSTHLPIDLSATRLLVVDDSEDNQALMSIFLKRSGATYVTAENGEEGVDRALSEDFDLILMDIEMPVMDGVAATRLLRSRGYSKPIVALTAHAMTEFQKTAKDAGFSHHLTKPISKERLLALLTEIQNQKLKA
jgi:signal transduction histidine kinase/CheY-like chemotaxis protein